MSTLKIASWNINSVRARTAIVERFLVEEAPDILCLQETKVRDDDFPQEMFRRLGYKHIVTCGQPMHHGVATISRIPIVEEEVVLVRRLRLKEEVRVRRILAERDETVQAQLRRERVDVDEEWAYAHQDAAKSEETAP